MKISAALSPLWDLLQGIRIAFLPTIKAILAKPTLLLTPGALSRVFMAHIWEGGFGDGTDLNGRPAKEGLITPNAYGVVLDIGAGHGHTVQYLDRTKVTHYVALEPNAQMHPFIRAAAAAGGFHESDGTLVIVSCGAEDTTSILSALPSSPNSNSTSNSTIHPHADTIISVLTLCTVPSPQRTLHTLVRDVLRPNGGVFLFYEHVLSHRADVAWWQRAWTPIWGVGFDGCRLDRDTGPWVQGLKIDGVEGGVVHKGGEEGESPWKESALWGKEGEDEENLFWHQAGRFVKK